MEIDTRIAFSLQWIFLFPLFISFSLATPAVAQQDSGSASSIIWHDAKNALNDGWNIFSSPAHFDSKDWIIAGAITGGVFLLFSIDEQARQLSERNQSSFGDDIFDLSREYGRAEYGILFSGGMYLGGLGFKDRWTRETGLVVFESILYAGTFTTIIKTVAGRSRPYLEEGAFHFDGFQTGNDRLSMPSGHSTVAFAISSSLSSRINNTYATIGLYSLATLTAFSRVYHDQHWLADTFLGAVIGTAVGTSLVHRRDHSTGDLDLHVLPSMSGMRVEFRF